MGNLGRLLLLTGGVLVLLGVVLLGGERLGLGRLGLGRLPGDLHFNKRGVEVWIPITSALVVSAVLSLALNLLRIIFRR
jgi:hypothetical protein